MTTTQIAPLKQKLRQLKWSETALKLDELIRVAEQKDMGYLAFLHHLVTYEQYRRKEKQQEKRMKWAAFPRLQTLEEFDCDQQPALSRKQFNQLQELLCLEQVYNLLLLGPPGVGKMMMAIGLGIQAIEQGYQVSFITTAILDRLLHRSEVITLGGDSQRLKNRKTIFG